MGYTSKDGQNWARLTFDGADLSGDTQSRPLWHQWLRRPGHNAIRLSPKFTEGSGPAERFEQVEIQDRDEALEGQKEQRCR